MQRAFKGVVLSVVMILGVVEFSSASFGQNSPITVSVFSDVPVPRGLLDGAERRAGQIFSVAGVEITWINCTQAADTGPRPACTRDYGPDDFVLRITSHVSGVTSDAAFGVAFLGSNGRGRYADVFWKRAQAFDPDSSSRLDRILGSVMAHELGHLLLGRHSHSVTGVMRAHWGSNELRCINMGALYFLPEQGKRMRTRIAESTSALISSRTR